jgi:hydrogenase 3 maturation protease
MNYHSKKNPLSQSDKQKNERLAVQNEVLGDHKATETLSFDAGFAHDSDFLSLNSNNNAGANLSIVDLSIADLGMAGIESSIIPSAASAKMLSPEILDGQWDKVVLTVGNTMMADDGAGPCLAQKMIDNAIDGWLVIDGGTIPEDNIHILRRIKPKFLILVDAAEMAEKAGTVRIIDPEMIADMFIMSTHSLPLNFLIDELKQFILRVEFVGIQPAIVAFSFPMTEMVEEGVEEVYQTIKQLTELESELPSKWID